MAVTSYPVNDPLAVKLWSRALAKEALKATEIAPLIGKGTNSIIQMKTETQKGAGDKVTCGLRMQLSGDGVTENETLEGNEEDLTTYDESIFINELAHAVRVKAGVSIDNQRVLFNARMEARDGLKDWYSKRMSVSFFNQVAGNTVPASTKYTGLNAVTAPSTSRYVPLDSAAAGHGADEDIGTADVMSLQWIDYLKEKAVTADPQIRPVNVQGMGKMYVIYLHPYQVTDLRTNTNSGQWLDIQKSAMMGGRITKNPIFTGALGVYNDVVIRWSHDVPLGINSGTGAAISTVRRAVFLGAQAALTAFGRDRGPTNYKWVEETFDYKRQLGVSVQTIKGMKKCIFNSTDFGVIVLSTYAAAHA